MSLLEPGSGRKQEPKLPILFGEKEGKIARANRGRDPLYLFSALQRQLGYPEVPRPRRPDEAEARIALIELTPQQASLEEAFMELTRDAVEFGTPMAEVAS